LIAGFTTISRYMYTAHMETLQMISFSRRFEV